MPLLGTYFTDCLQKQFATILKYKRGGKIGQVGGEEKQGEEERGEMVNVRGRREKVGTRSKCSSRTEGKGKGVREKAVIHYQHSPLTVVNLNIIEY